MAKGKIGSTVGLSVSAQPVRKVGFLPVSPLRERPPGVNITKVMRTPINMCEVIRKMHKPSTEVATLKIWDSSMRSPQAEEFRAKFKKWPTSKELSFWLKLTKLGINVQTLSELYQYAEKAHVQLKVLNLRFLPQPAAPVLVRSCKVAQVVSQSTAAQSEEQQVSQQPQTTVVVTQEIVSLQRCVEFIKSLLATKPGEVLGMPNFGSRLWDMLFENITPKLLEKIKQIIDEDLAAVCPDIKKTITVAQSSQDVNVVQCRIALSLESMKMVVNVNISSGKVEVL